MFFFLFLSSHLAFGTTFHALTQYQLISCPNVQFGIETNRSASSLSEASGLLEFSVTLHTYSLMLRISDIREREHELAELPRSFQNCQRYLSIPLSDSSYARSAATSVTSG